MRIALLHGWGFDAGVWRELTPLLPPMLTPSPAPFQADWAVLMDRGYFGAPVDGARPDLMIGHSLGAMLLARRWPDVPLVAINGFDRFCGPGGVAPRVLERMIKRFAADPARVLSDFRASIGGQAPPAIVSRERLGDDLALLADQSAPAPHGAPVLVLQAGDDPLLPPAMRAGTFGGAFGGAATALCPDGGHLLPLTRPQWCAARIADFAP